MKKILIYLSIVLLFLSLAGAGMGYYGFLWAVKNAEVKLLQQLNTHPIIKAGSVHVNLEAKKIHVRQLHLQHERMSMTIPELILSTTHDLPYLIEVARSNKIQKFFLQVQIPEFKINHFKISSKKTLQDISGHVDMSLDINQNHYQLNIGSMNIDRFVNGSLFVRIDAESMNLPLSKQIKTDALKFLQANLKSWEKIRIVEINGQATNEGLGEVIRGMVQIEQRKLNELLQTGIQLLSSGTLSDGEKLSKDVLSTAYYFMNSNSEIGFAIKPQQNITAMDILTNLQSKLDLGVMDLGLRLWVKK